MAPQGSVSVREYIRWLPGKAEEPTSTVVLTSPERRFVDLRILKTAFTSRKPGESLSPGCLDWAIAGTSTSVPGTDSDGVPTSHGTWHHWIDSRAKDADGLADQGDNYAQADGTTLEKGSMVNPATGLVTAYEELWRDLALYGNNLPKPPRCLVWQLDDREQKARGMAVMLGGYCQGLVRFGERVSLERWEEVNMSNTATPNGEDGWQMTARMGEDDVPCHLMVRSAGQNNKVGSEIEVGGQHGRPIARWTVVENEDAGQY